MSFFTYKPLVKGAEIPDSAADRGAAVRVGRYYIGKEAIYVPGFPLDRYIPFRIIRRVWSQPSSICATGCCGKGVPVVVVCVVYEAEGRELLEKYILDTQAEADRLLELVGRSLDGENF